MFATCADPDSLWWQAQILLALENRDTERIDWLVRMAEANAKD